MLLSLTVLAAGRFCIALLSEHLGPWRRWWVVLPLTAILAWIVAALPDRFGWQLTATPFIALAGVLCAGYRHDPKFEFTAGEQRLAAAAWFCGSAAGIVANLAEHSLPVLAWSIGFLVLWAGLRLKGLQRVVLSSATIWPD